MKVNKEMPPKIKNIFRREDLSFNTPEYRSGLIIPKISSINERNKNNTSAETIFFIPNL